MCCCGKPVINGQPGFKWQPNDAPRIHPVNPPALDEYETLLYDEPGRCGGLDAHCHHYRVVRMFSSVYLLVQHGGGKERIPLHTTKHFMPLLESLDTHGRYWLLHTLYYAHHEGKEEGTQQTRRYWQDAAREKRIKVRKGRGINSVTVRIEPRLIST